MVHMITKPPHGTSNTSIDQQITLAPRTYLVSTLWVNDKRCQRQDTDDEGGHDVVERVELRLAAQHQRVLDVGEVLQHLKDIESQLFLLSSQDRLISNLISPAPLHNSLSTVLFQL